MIGDDALVATLVLEFDVAQMEDGCVLHDACSVSGGGVGEVLHVGMRQRLLVFPPREGHGGAAAADRHARQTHVFSQHTGCGCRVNRDLRFGQVFCWGEKKEKI